MRLLPCADRRRPENDLRGRRGLRRGQARPHPRRAERSASGRRPPGRSRWRPACSAASAFPASCCAPSILLDRNPSPSRDEIARALDVHLCRCTGYVKIVDAIELMARAWRGEPMPEPLADGRRRAAARSATRVGEAGARRASLRGRHDARRACSTARSCSRRTRAPGCCGSTRHGRGRFPACARWSRPADVPGERWYGLLYDDWPGFVAEGEEVRCVGDVLAAVAADDARTARARGRPGRGRLRVRSPPCSIPSSPSASSRPG